MARSRKMGDDAYNARRRYTRQAQRYLKQADNTTGEASRRYRALAEQAYTNAIGTYADSSSSANFSSEIKKLASRFGQVVGEARNRLNRARLIRESSKAKSPRGLTDQQRRDMEGRQLLNTFVGHRIFGGMQNIWEKDALERKDDGTYKINQEKALELLKDYFGVDDVLGIIEAFEEQFSGLYAKPSSQVQYDEIVLAAQSVFVV